MRLKTVTVLLALALGSMGAVAGCAHKSSATAGGAATPAPVTTLQVINNGALDMDVFALRSPGGQRIRLGTATASVTTNMRIPSNLLFGTATSMRFIADPIGGRHVSVSSSVLVNPGDQVTLRIPR